MADGEHIVKPDLAAMRRRYTLAGLLEPELPDNPAELFEKWIMEALESAVMEPNAMALATVDGDGRPEVRTVLLKQLTEKYITFFTNYRSDKGRQLEVNPHVACCFWWPELERQIRINGAVSRVSRRESEAYFAERPRESQIGAWASVQSEVVSGREELERQFNEVSKRFEGAQIPPPDEWGGYALEIEKMEFWQGRPGRLHDRILYRRNEPGWERVRLAP